MLLSKVCNGLGLTLKFRQCKKVQRLSRQEEPLLKQTLNILRQNVCLFKPPAVLKKRHLSVLAVPDSQAWWQPGSRGGTATGGGMDLEAFPSLRPGDAKSIRPRGLSRLFRSAESASALKAFWREGAEKSTFRSGLRPSWAWHTFPVSPAEGGREGSLGFCPAGPPPCPAPSRAGLGERGWEAVPREKEMSLPQGTARKNPAGREARNQPGRSGGRGTAPPLGVFGKVKPSLFAHLRAPAARGMQARLQLLSPRQGAGGAARGERQRGKRPGCGKVAWCSLGSSWGARRGSRSARAPPPILLPPSLPPSPGGLPAGLPSLPGASPERFPLIGFCGLWVFWGLFF